MYEGTKVQQLLVFLFSFEILLLFFLKSSLLFLSVGKNRESFCFKFEKQQGTRLVFE